MRTQSFVFAVAISLAAMACAHREPAPRATETRAPVTRGAPPAARHDWTRLGEAWVNGTRDRDVITVGAREGSFRRVMIVVEHSALEMYDVIITFADGDRFSPPMRLMFAENSRSQVIDLPGNRRVIRSVEFRYGNLPGGGRAQAELWAQ